MWVSRNKWDELEKRVADLEGQVQSQLKKAFVPEDSDRIYLNEEKSCEDIIV